MRNRRVSQKLKSFGTFLVILILLPYVMTIFIHGAENTARGNVDNIFVKVKTVDNQEENQGNNQQEQTVEVPWEEYFIGVLAREALAGCEPECLKAQAVLIRTKLYQEAENGDEPVFTERYFSAEELEKRRGEADYQAYLERLESAMETTENQVLLYQETYAWTPYHKSNNGMTRSAQEVLGEDGFPYLGVRECPADKEAEEEMQIRTFGYEEVQAKCRPFLVAVDAKESEKTYRFEDFEILSYDSAGYVKELRIGETVCTGDQFRDALSLPSSAFSLQDSENGLKVTTTGNGHGLGMSQWTANKMAEEGKSYEEILQFFFEGTSLTDGGDISGKIFSKAE